MSSRTSGSPGIGDTGSGDAAYISGLVMMDVIMRRWKGGSVRCRRWDRPFFILPLLSLGTSCRTNWRVMTLVSSFFKFLVHFLYLRDKRIDSLTPLLPSIFFPFCWYHLGNSCVEAWCVDAAVTVNFFLFHCYRLVIL